MPWFARLLRPPTTEQKGFTPVTEVWILLMQGLVLIGLLAIAGALAMAALLAWDVEVLAVKAVGYTSGLVAVLLLATPSLSRVDGQGKAVALLLALILGYSVAAVAAFDVLALTDGMDVEIARALAVALAAALGLTLGTALTFGGHYRAAGWLLLLLTTAAGLAWWQIPAWAQSDLWPWALSGLALCFGYGAFWTAQAFKTEIRDPQDRGMTGLERAMLEWVRNEIGSDGDDVQGPAISEPVLINPPRDRLLEERRRWEWERFLLMAAANSSTERLEKAGFPRRSRIEPWRDALMASGWAEWVDDRRHNLGWTLAADVETILENMSFGPDIGPDDE